MKPIDYRNETWSGLQARLTTDRLAVLEALRIHGPCTTRQLAAAMGWDILSVRPRVTELVQLDFAEVVDPNPSQIQRSKFSVESSTLPAPREGLYMARSEPEAWDAFHARKEAAVSPQLHLPIQA